MKNILISFLLLFAIECSVFCQKMHIPEIEKHTENTIGYFAEYNFSWYKNSFNVNNFFANNLSAGISMKFPISKKLSISSSPSLGIKFKKEYDYRFDILGKIDKNANSYPNYSILEIDNIDQVFGKNHYYIEVPISIKYDLIMPFSIGTGVSGRYYFKSASTDIAHLDFFERSIEYKLLASISWKIKDKVILELVHSNTLNRIYSVMIVTVPEEVNNFDGFLKSRDLRCRIIIPF